MDRLGQVLAGLVLAIVVVYTGVHGGKVISRAFVPDPQPGGCAKEDASVAAQ